MGLSVGFASVGLSPAGLSPVLPSAAFLAFFSAFFFSRSGSFGLASSSLQAGVSSALCSFRQSAVFLPAAFASLQNLALSSLQGFLAKATVAVAGTKKAIMTNATSCFMPIHSNASEKGDGVHTRTGDSTIERIARDRAGVSGTRNIGDVERQH